MKIEFEAWKRENPDQVFLQKDFPMAAVNMHVFEYDPIKDQQVNKEFWVNPPRTGDNSWRDRHCPPVGLVLEQPMVPWK